MSRKTLPAFTHYAKHKPSSGFTLIELSIVLVIIGLLIGGVLFGKDMVRAAELRSMLSLKDQFAVATNSFKQKYNALPGDMDLNQTAKFGFFTFTGPAFLIGPTSIYRLYYGSNNGVINGHYPGGSGFHFTSDYHCHAECGAFWRHLVDAGLIQGNYGKHATKPLLNNGADGSVGAPTGENTWFTGYTSSIYMPKAGGINAYFGVNSETLTGAVAAIDPDTNTAYHSSHPASKRNFFYLTAPYTASSASMTMPSLTPIDMQSIDSKTDDGKPNSGKVTDMGWYNAAPTIESIGTYDDDSGEYQYGCTTGGTGIRDPNITYNTNPATGGNIVACAPVFVW